MRVLGIAGWSGSGKTTLVSSLIPALKRRGMTVSTVKHAHHSFDVDQPGKDSRTHRLAGATEVLVSSSERWALMHEHHGAPEPGLDTLLTNLSPVDLVLVEGWKHGDHPKIEVIRVATKNPPLHPDQDSVIAVATDDPATAFNGPVLDLNDIDAIADFICGWHAAESG